MKFLVTGGNGFIARNLTIHLQENGHEVITFVRGDSADIFDKLISQVDGVFHLAGENRPADPAAFHEVNAKLTQTLCDAIARGDRPVPLILASSTQVLLENNYGASKRSAEMVAKEMVAITSGSLAIYRLPGVFGKWCRPNYNSVVATFCHNLANDQEIKINDSPARLTLVYIDDVVSSFHTIMLDMCAKRLKGVLLPTINPMYETTLIELAQQLRAFKKCRTSLEVDRVGDGLTRALYATYISYLPKDKFLYEIPAYRDERGIFVEILKTPDAGQFAFFTALPGVTRGGHYHHTKTEKFLVVRGLARFRFRHLLTNEQYVVVTDGEVPKIVETIPGWTHDVTNIGNEELVVMVWASEKFERMRPDTIMCKV